MWTRQLWSVAGPVSVTEGEATRTTPFEERLPVTEPSAPGPPPSLAALDAARRPFADRHIGLSDADVATMLDALGYDSLDALMDTAVPKAIRLEGARWTCPARCPRTGWPRSCGRSPTPTGRGSR